MPKSKTPPRRQTSPSLFSSDEDSIIWDTQPENDNGWLSKKKQMAKKRNVTHDEVTQFMGRRKREREELAKKTLPEGMTPPPSVLGSVLADTQPPVDLDETVGSIPQEVVNMVNEHVKEEEQLFTFVYRGPKPFISREGKMSYIIVNHINEEDPHYHFVFRSLPGNKFRAFSNITRHAGIPDIYVTSCQSTLQAVRNWQAFAAYLNKDEKCHKQLVGLSMAMEYDDILLARPQHKREALIKREERRSQPRITNYEQKRQNRMQAILDIIDKYRPNSLPDLKKKILKREVLSLYESYGKSWEETATICIDAIVEEKIALEKLTPFSQFMHEVVLHGHNACSNHTYLATYHESFQWLLKLFEVNHIDPKCFCDDVYPLLLPHQ